MDPLFEVVYEDAELLVVNKPAGLVCHPTKGDKYSSLISRLRLYLSDSAQVHLINRLDRETSGIVVAAKQREAAVGLRRLWETRAVEKEYWAIVHGHPPSESGVIEAPLGKDEASVVAIKDCVRPDGAEAATSFDVVRRFWRGGMAFSLLRAFPRTGRKHQIRIHLAHLGYPIVGDKLYGGDEQVYLAFVKRRMSPEQERRMILPFHALHARSARFEWNRETKEFVAEPEVWFREFSGE